MAADQIMGQTLFTSTEGNSVNTSPLTYDHVQLVLMAQKIFPVGMD